MSNVEKRDGSLPLNVHALQTECRTMEVRMRGFLPQVFCGTLRVLIPKSMYVLMQIPDGMQGFKPGQVLVRNLELTRRAHGAKASYDQQIFVRYDNLFDAYRAMMRLRPHYDGVEVPEMQNWLQDSDKMMHLAWELTAVDIGSHVEYQAIGYAKARKHARVRNDDKKHAVKKTVKATSVQDVRGRFNAGRLPLVLLSVDTALWKRIRAARGIGHRMDFRAVVLELVIMKLLYEAKTAQEGLKHLLRRGGIFDSPRKPSEILRVCETMRMTADALSRLAFRPFKHVFDHCVKDMYSAIAFMEASLGGTPECPQGTHATRDPMQLAYAKVSLNRAYRSLEMIKFAWLIQELLVTVSGIYHRKEILSLECAKQLGDSVLEIQGLMRTADTFTSESWEKDFRNPVLDRVDESLACAEDKMSFGGSRADLALARKHLKAALAPL